MTIGSDGQRVTVRVCGGYCRGIGESICGLCQHIAARNYLRLTSEAVIFKQILKAIMSNGGVEAFTVIASCTLYLTVFGVLVKCHHAAVVLRCNKVTFCVVLAYGNKAVLVHIRHRYAYGHIFLVILRYGCVDSVMGGYTLYDLHRFAENVYGFVKTPRVNSALGCRKRAINILLHRYIEEDKWY